MRRLRPSIVCRPSVTSRLTLRPGSLLATAFTLALCGGASTGATTFPPVTFDELVTRAEVIFTGEVIDVRAFPLQTREGTIVKTRVIFRVADPIFESGSTLEVFEFFGGKWGDIGMAIGGMPRFAIGDRHIVFARRDRSINPIVGFTQGLLRVGRDGAGIDRVFTSDGLPLGQPEHIGLRARGAAVAPASAMRLSDFRERISRALAEARRR